MNDDDIYLISYARHLAFVIRSNYGAETYLPEFNFNDVLSRGQEPIEHRSRAQPITLFNDGYDCSISFTRKCILMKATAAPVYIALLFKISMNGYTERRIKYIQ